MLRCTFSSSHAPLSSCLGKDFGSLPPTVHLFLPSDFLLLDVAPFLMLMHIHGMIYLRVLALGLPDIPYFTGAPVFDPLSPASREEAIREMKSPVFQLGPVSHQSPHNYLVILIAISGSKTDRQAAQVFFRKYATSNLSTSIKQCIYT